MRLRPIARLVSTVLLGFLLAFSAAHADGEFRRFPAAAAPSVLADGQIDPAEAPGVERRDRPRAQPAPYQPSEPQGVETVGPGALQVRRQRISEPAPVVEAADPEGDEVGDSEEAGVSEAAADSETAEASPEAEVAPRAGCMYRDATLIWERVPGTCKP